MKKYNFDKYFSIVNARKEEEITGWLVLLYDQNMSLIEALPETMIRAEPDPKYDKIIIASKNYPNSFKLSFETISLVEIKRKISFVEYVPLFSTRRGWKWNKKQILDCLKKYPNAAHYLLNIYLGDPHTQIYFRKIFKKHFRCFLKDISELTVKIAGIRYYAGNCTVKKVTRDERDYNTFYFSTKHIRYRRLSDNMAYIDHFPLSNS